MKNMRFGKDLDKVRTFADLSLACQDLVHSSNHTNR